MHKHKQVKRVKRRQSAREKTHSDRFRIQRINLFLALVFLSKRTVSTNSSISSSADVSIKKKEEEKEKKEKAEVEVAATGIIANIIIICCSVSSKCRQCSIEQLFFTNLRHPVVALDANNAQSELESVIIIIIAASLSHSLSLPAKHPLASLSS